MDPQEIGRLRDFSDTLTHVLAQLDGKYRELTSGSTKLLGITSTLDKHSAIIQSLEKSREEQLSTLNDALKAQTTLSQDVLDMTATQCNEIQKDIVGLRTATKQELDKLQGHLQITFLESMETILSKTYTPAAEFPTITRDMTPEKILSIMNGRINSLESQMKIQLVTNQMLKNSLHNDVKMQDRFDELSSKLVQTERLIESERRKISKLDKQVNHILNVQTNIDNSLKLIDQKISLLTSAQFSNGFNFQNIPTQNFNNLNSNSNSNSSNNNPSQSEILQLLQTPLPDLNTTNSSNGNGKRSSSVSRQGSLHHDPSKVMAMKSFLREKRLSMKENNESKSPNDHSSSLSTGNIQSNSNINSNSSTHPGSAYLSHQMSSLNEFDDEFGGSSVDSQGLIDEFVLEKIENLDNLITDQILNKVANNEKFTRQLTTEINTVKETIKELEIISSEYSNKSGGGGLNGSNNFLMETNFNLFDEKKFKSFSYEMKEMWEKINEETEKKLNKIDQIIKQIESTNNSNSNSNSNNNNNNVAGLNSSSSGNNNNNNSNNNNHSSSTHLQDDVYRKLNNYKNKVKNFVEYFNSCIENSTKEEMLLKFTDPLNDLLKDSNDISKLETIIRDSNNSKLPGVTLPISYVPSKLPDLIKSTKNKTIQFLNKNINKLDLLNEINEIKEHLSLYVPLNLYQQNNEDIKIALTLKSDQKIVDNLIIKKASNVDLQKFKEYINDEIDSMREMLVKNSTNSTKLLANVTNSNISNDLFNDLNGRFHIILDQFNEIKRSISGYVPRPEIETALQSILNEIRDMKKITVEKDLLNEKLKHKADKDEVERLLNILASSIGDPSNGNALAMHLKCLSCDKPINPFGIGPQGFSQLQHSHSDDDDRLNWTTYPRNDNPISPLTNRPNTSNMANNRTLTSKSTPQLRHSTELLPPVNNNNNNNINNNNNPQSVTNNGQQNIDRQNIKSRQNNNVKPNQKPLTASSGYISTSGVQGSYLTNSRA